MGGTEHSNSLQGVTPALTRAFARAEAAGPGGLPLRLGALALAVTVAHVIALPAGVLPVLLAALAAFALGRVPALGALGGALVVVLAVPFGRGADVDVFAVGAIPIRPADAAILVGVLAALPAIRRPAMGDRAMLIALGAFLAVGAVALLIGVTGDNATRDILRDARWWGLYGAAGVAILARVPAARLLRALDVGATVFAVVAVATVVLPVFEGGLKEQALWYDRGTLRMQFGNTVFLLPVIARVADGLIVAPRWRHAAWLGLLVMALVLSLTRTSMLVMLGMGALVVLIGIVASTAPIRARAIATGFTGITVAVALAAGVGLAQFATVASAGQPVTGPDGKPVPASSPGTGESPIDRITFQSDASDMESTIAAANGRMTTYANAIAVIRQTPVIGAGLGSLIDVPFAYHDTRAHTIGKQPGVDNAYITIGLKAGAVGVLAYLLLMGLPLLLALRVPDMRRWFIPAWGALLGLGMTQSFAVSGYAPFALGLLLAAAAVGYASTRGATAFAQR